MSRTLFAAATALALVSAAGAQDSFTNTSEASEESAEGVAAMVEAGAKVTVGVVAVPIASAAATSNTVGSTAETIADELWDAANSPLSVDDDVIVAPAPQGPPSVPSSADGDTASTPAE